MILPTVIEKTRTVPIFFIVLLISAIEVFAADTGFISPTLDSVESGQWNSVGGTLATDVWSGETSAYSYDNLVTTRGASTVATGAPYYADHSWGGFDFSAALASGDTINGIEVALMNAYELSAAGVDRFHATLYTKNNGGGHDVWGWTGSTYTSADWNTIIYGSSVTFGGATDTWGLTNPTGADFGPNTTFKIKIFAENSALGDKAYFDHIKVIIYYTAGAGESIAPAAISNLTALAGIQDGETELNWTSPGDDGTTGNLTGTYSIKCATYVITADNFAAIVASSYFSYVFSVSTSALAPLTAVGATITGLNPGTTYFFAIKTNDDANNWSVWPGTSTLINIASFAPGQDKPPAAPGGFSADPGNAQVSLTWSAAVIPGNFNDIDFYRVYYDSGAPADGQPDWAEGESFVATNTVNTSYTHTGLSNGTTYHYRILTYDWGDRGQGLFSPQLSGGYSTTQNAIPTATPPMSPIYAYFDTGPWPPTGWTINDITMSTGSTRAISEPNSVICAAVAKYLFTPYLTTPATFSFQLTCTGGASTFGVEKGTSTSVSGTWDVLLTTGGFLDPAWGQVDIDLTAYNNIYVRVHRASGANTYNLDDATITVAAAGGDVTPPSAVTNLSGLTGGTGDYGKTIWLRWTAPGDDGASGNIIDGRFRIKWSTYTTAASDFWTTGAWTDYKNQYSLEFDTGTPTPVVPGSNPSLAVTSLYSGVTYYFRLWTRDEVSANWSSVSSGATAYASLSKLSIDLLEPDTYYNFGVCSTGISTVTGRGVFIRNDDGTGTGSNLRETYELCIDSSVLPAGATLQWSIGITTYTGYNQAVLYAIVCSTYNVTVSTQHFSGDPGYADDILRASTFYTCSSVIFASSTLTSVNGNGVGVEPYSVNPKKSDRAVYFRLDTPAAVSTEFQQTIPVIIRAREEE